MIDYTHSEFCSRIIQDTINIVTYKWTYHICTKISDNIIECYLDCEIYDTTGYYNKISNKIAYTKHMLYNIRCCYDTIAKNTFNRLFDEFNKHPVEYTPEVKERLFNNYNIDFMNLYEKHLNIIIE